MVTCSLTRLSEALKQLMLCRLLEEEWNYVARAEIFWPQIAPESTKNPKIFWGSMLHHTHYHIINNAYSQKLTTANVAYYL